MRINKRSMIKISLLSFLMLITTHVHAFHTYAGVHKVDRYYPISDDFVYIRMDAPHIDPAGCGAAAGSYYSMDRANVPAFDEYRKVMLTAKATGLSLIVYIHNEPGNCWGKAPRISRIILQ